MVRAQETHTAHRVRRLVVPIVVGSLLLADAGAAVATPALQNAPGPSGEPTETPTPIPSGGTTTSPLPEPTTTPTPGPTPGTARPTASPRLTMTSPAWDRLRLSWSAVPRATSYRVASAGRIVRTVRGTSWLRTGLAPTTPYNAGVQGCNAAGCGPWSRTVTAATARPGSSQPTTVGVTRRDLPHTYRSGCPVGPSGLRRLTVWHWDFGGRVRRGELFLRASAVPDIAYVFERAYRARFPIRQMRRVDVWRGSDVRAMAADNTSMFNCRTVTGNPYRMSRHSYGDAIDVNTFENPYQTGSRVYPAAARSYLNRRRYRKGMILPGSAIATAMRTRGWPWGARWANPDYQHWSKTGA